MLTITYRYARETKTCYVYESGEPRTPEHQSLYLKKTGIEAAGIDPKRPITVTISQAAEEGG